MLKHLHHFNFHIENIKEIKVCESVIYQVTGSSFIKPFDFNRVINEEHNLDNCVNCQKKYDRILKEFEIKLKKFPFCCTPHKALSDQAWFVESDFKYIPKLATDKIFYTWHFILKYIDSPNWEEEIHDYIYHIIYTFGSFPKGFGPALFIGDYYFYIKALVDSYNHKKYNKKKALIIDLIDNIFDSLNKSNKNKTNDIDILLEIYNKWYKSFPFELSIFSDLKSNFSSKLPIFEKTVYNKYMEVHLSIPRTKTSLFKYLMELTNQIITQISSSLLYERGLLGDLESYKVELIVQKRKFKLNEGYLGNSNNPDLRYKKMLKEWLIDELEFISELMITVKANESKSNNLFKDILYACNKMQDNKMYWDVDENSRTKFILDILGRQYFTKDQSQAGVSGKGIKPGSIDGIIISNDVENYIEALNLEYINKKYIQDHINKLEKKYDAKGLKNKYIIIYCNILENSFNNFCENYYDFIENTCLYEYELDNTSNLNVEYINQKIFKTTHTRALAKVNIYHILINMPKHMT